MCFDFTAALRGDFLKLIQTLLEFLKKRNVILDIITLFGVDCLEFFFCRLVLLIDIMVQGFELFCHFFVQDFKLIADSLFSKE